MVVEVVVGDVGEKPARETEPRVRSCTMACDEHSMKQYSHPASTISRIMAFRRMASGVAGAGAAWVMHIVEPFAGEYQLTRARRLRHQANVIVRPACQTALA